jgi:uncharacterized protein (TIGR02996 family)
MRTFTYSDAKSHKFWNIDLQGNQFTVTYGRIGSAGQTQTKAFKDAATAQKEHDKLVKEKLGKGYQETTPSAKAQPRSLREALEEALAANPDDLASHMAYADWLSEQADKADQARGELVRVQLALEDEKKPAKERKKLQQQEEKLLKAHARDWLGELAPHLLAPSNKEGAWGEPSYSFQFRRGWLDTLEATYFTLEFTRALAHAPEARLLRCLLLNEDHHEPPETYEAAGDPIPEGSYGPAPFALLRSPYLGNLRTLRFGEAVPDDERYFNSRMSGEPVIGLVKAMPRLEELYLLAQTVDTDQLFGLRTLTRLRVLQVYHMDHYPLQRLANNPAFANLTHLLCHPHVMREDEPYLRLPQLRAVVRSTVLTKLTHLRLRQGDWGDKGCDEVVASGALKRLKVLDLRNGRITDAGARVLAACPDLKNLEVLDLDRNCLTEEGVGALRATGVRVVARDQWVPTGDEGEDRQYLYEGDGE